MEIVNIDLIFGVSTSLGTGRRWRRRRRRRRRRCRWRRREVGFRTHWETPWNSPSIHFQSRQHRNPLKISVQTAKWWKLNRLVVNRISKEKAGSTHPPWTEKQESNSPGIIPTWFSPHCFGLGLSISLNLVMLYWVMDIQSFWFHLIFWYIIHVSHLVIASVGFRDTSFSDQWSHSLTQLCQHNQI